MLDNKISQKVAKLILEQGESESKIDKAREYLSELPSFELFKIFCI